MRSQDLRLARHSVESNLDLTMSLLRSVRDASDLDQAERDEAGRILAEIEPLHGAEGIEEEERLSRLSPIASALHHLDDRVNGPLPSDR